MPLGGTMVTVTPGRRRRPGRARASHTPAASRRSNSNSTRPPLSLRTPYKRAGITRLWLNTIKSLGRR